MSRDELSCPDEREILNNMIKAGRVEGGFVPHDIPALTVMLANHRKNCPFCNGTALDQLFGCKVVVMKREPDELLTRKTN